MCVLEASRETAVTDLTAQIRVGSYRNFATFYPRSFWFKITVSNLACSDAVFLIKPSTTRYSVINTRHPSCTLSAKAKVLLQHSKREAHSFKLLRRNSLNLNATLTREGGDRTSLTGDVCLPSLPPSSARPPLFRTTLSFILRLHKVANERARACVCVVGRR
jgi:hypothetical protein